MNEDFAHKFEQWLEPKTIPMPIAPVHLAAKFLAFRENFLAQYPDDAEKRELIKAYVSGVCMSLHHIAEINRTGMSDIKLKLKLLGAFLKSSFHHYILSNPDAFNWSALPTTQSYNDFMNLADSLSKSEQRKDPMENFKGIREGMLYYLSRENQYAGYVDELKASFDNLILLGNTWDNEPLLKTHLKVFSPSEGPATTEEMLLCSLLLLKSRNVTEATSGSVGSFDIPEKEVDYYLALITELLLRMQSDISPLSLEGPHAFFGEKFLAAERILETHAFGSRRVVGFLRYYLDHNKEKLRPEDYKQLSDLTVSLDFALMKDGLLRSQHDNVGDMDEAQRAEYFLHYSQKYRTDYQKPTPDKVIGDLITTIRASGRAQREIGERIRGFENALSRRPQQMEEVVLLHYEESAEVRKLRDRLFSKPVGSNGEDGPKVAFLKGIAKDERPALLALGLMGEMIDDMAQTGKLPKDCGLNVEHIIDRQHGGTNHDHNFILMPAEINRQKDELKKKQINMIPDAAKGCWIISWVPKKLEDGTYPRVWPVPTNQDFSVQAQMEAACPNPPQL